MRASWSNRNYGFHRRIGLATLFLFVSLLQLALPGDSASAQVTYTLPWMNGSVWRIVRDEVGHGGYSYDAVYVRGGDALVSPVAPGVVRGVANDTPNDWVYNGPYAGHGGNCVIIEHPDGNWSLYAHLLQGSIKVHEGQEVGPGTELGRMGWSGVVIPKSTGGSHLHWEVGQRSRMYTDTYRTCVTDNTKQMRYSDNDAELREDGGIPRPGRYYESTGGIALNCDPRPLRVVYYDKPMASANVGYELSTGFVVKNINADACGVYTAQLIGMAGRGPGGDTDVQDFPLAQQIGVIPGFTYRYDGSRSFQTPGAHSAWPVAQGRDGSWYALVSEDGQPLGVSFDIVGLPQPADPPPALPESAEPEPDTTLPAEPDESEVPTTIPGDTPHVAFAPGQIVQAAEQGISLHSEPDDSATIVADIPVGETITILYGPYAGDSGWYVALSNRSVGWVSSASLVSTAATSPDTPGATGTSSSASASGQQSSTSASSGSSSGTSSGQATTSGSAAAPATQEVQANTSLLLRAEPGKGLVSITPDNSTGQVVGEPVVLNGTIWYRVDFGKWGTGWVAVIYLEIRTTAVPAVAASSSAVTPAVSPTTVPDAVATETEESTPAAPVVVMPMESPTATGELADATQAIPLVVMPMESPTETPEPSISTLPENATATELPQENIAPEQSNVFSAGRSVTVSSDANMYQEANPASLLLTVLPMNMGGVILAGPVDAGGTSWYQIDAGVYGIGWVDSALLGEDSPVATEPVIETQPDSTGDENTATDDASSEGLNSTPPVSNPTVESETQPTEQPETQPLMFVTPSDPNSEQTDTAIVSSEPTAAGESSIAPIDLPTTVPVMIETPIVPDEQTAATDTVLAELTPSPEMMIQAINSPTETATVVSAGGFFTPEPQGDGSDPVFSEVSPTPGMQAAIQPIDGIQPIDSNAVSDVTQPSTEIIPAAGQSSESTTFEQQPVEMIPTEDPFSVQSQDGTTLQDQPLENGTTFEEITTGPLQSVHLALLAGGPEQAALVDGNPMTAWYLANTAGIPEGNFTVDLGSIQYISSVKWQQVPEGFAGTLSVQVSTDNVNWEEVPLDFSTNEEAWTVVRFDRDIQYVRFVFRNDAEASLPRLGGLAEIEIWP